MKILAIGAGRGLDQVIDAIGRKDEFIKRHISFDLVGALDDSNDDGSGLILGKINTAKAHILYSQKTIDACIITISTDIKLRKRIFEEFTEAGLPFVNIIHYTAYIADNAVLGTGNVILAQCHVGAHAIIGDNNFISAKCNIEHHNIIGFHNTFGPGVVFSSRVITGNEVRFGTGVFAEPGVVIGDRCLIGSGSVITYNREIKADHVLKTSYAKESER